MALPILQDYSNVLAASSFVSWCSNACFTVGPNLDVQMHPVVPAFLLLLLAAASISGVAFPQQLKAKGVLQVFGDDFLRAVPELCPSALQVQAQVIQETVVPKEPPPEFEFIADPPSISAFDLDVVKLTAQFVARNGRQFLTQLMQKEQRNYQFDFLRPQHSLFNYFTKLVEQYTKVPWQLSHQVQASAAVLGSGGY